MPTKRAFATIAVACALVGAAACGGPAHRSSSSPIPARALAGNGKADPANAPRGLSPTYPQKPAPSGPPVTTAGIIDLRQAPFSQSDFTVNNQYWDTFQNGYIAVFAGNVTVSNPDGSETVGAPGVRLYNGSDNQDLNYTGQYTIPGETTGSAKLVSVEGQSAVLSVTDGTSWRFNLVTHVFTPAP